MLPDTTRNSFSVEISTDRLSAVVHVEALAMVNAGAIAAHLKGMKVVDIDLSAISLALNKRAGGAAVSIKVATGTAPVAGPPPVIEPRQSVTDDLSGTFSTVEANQIVANVHAAKPGPSGRDVFGIAIASPPCSITSVGGLNTVVSENAITSKIRGNLRMSDSKIWVAPVMEFHGEKDTSTPQVNFAGDISVKGSLAERWRIRATGSVIVAGQVDAALINVKGSIYVRGGIVGKDKGKCLTEQSLSARFLSHACVIAGADVIVQGQVADSRVICAGRLTATGGPISGGKVTATRGVVCQTIGDASRTPTLIETGTISALPLVTAMARLEVETNFKRVKNIREKVEPLLAQMKNLTSQQREQTTEMLYEADELEAETRVSANALDVRLKQMREEACNEIIVSDFIYAGVALRLGNLETVIKTELKGPLRITTRKTGDVNEIVVYKDSGSTRALESRLVETPADAPPSAPASRAAA